MHCFNSEAHIMIGHVQYNMYVHADQSYVFIIILYSAKFLWHVMFLVLRIALEL